MYLTQPILMIFLPFKMGENGSNLSVVNKKRFNTEIIKLKIGEVHVGAKWQLATWIVIILKTAMKRAAWKKFTRM